MAVGTITRSIAQSSDNASEAPAGSPIAGGIIFAGAAVGAWCGLRFVDVNVPPGATITSAVVEVVLSDTSKNDAEGTWFGHDADDSATFTTADGDVDGRALTTASVAWTTNDLGSAGATASSPNLAAIAQEVVDRPGWERGNALTFLYRHESAAEFLQFAFLDNVTHGEPTLTLTFTTADYIDPDPIVELKVAGVWTDFSDYLVPQAFTIKRGRANEASRTQPATVGFEMDNTSGDLTPGDARSPHYPYIARHTHCRVRLPGGSTDTYLVLDGSLTDNVSTPDAASLDVATDLAVWFDGDIDWRRSRQQTSLVGKWKAAGDQRSYLFYVVNDGRLSLDFTDTGAYGTDGWAISAEALPFTNGRHAVAAELDMDTGAGTWAVQFYIADTAAGPWVPFGDPETLNWATNADPSPSLTIYNGTAPLEVGPITGELSTPPIGKVYSAGVRAGTLAGGTIVANPDFGAQAAGTTTFADTAAVPKTWTLNGTAEVSDIDDNRVRFTGQIDEVTPSWPWGDLSDPDDPDTTPGEARVTVNASGFLRRLGQGAKRLASPLFRAAMIPSPQLDGIQMAYWPCEDGNDATQFASPMPGVAPMTFGGEVRPAANSDNPASAPLPSVSGGQGFAWVGTIPYLDVDNWVVIASVYVPTLPASETVLLAIESAGTVVLWHITVDSANLRLRAYNGAGTEVFSVGGTATDFTDGWSQIYLVVEQEGGNVRRSNGWMTAAGTVFGGTSTIAGTVGPPLKLLNYATAPADGLSFGHFTVATEVSASWLGWTGGAYRAHVGEKAARRMERLCDEEGIAFRVIGDPDDTAPMGPQGTDTLPDLLQEAADADGGILYEERAHLGLVYRTRASLYNQAPVLALDASTRSVDGLVVADIVPPFEPTLDDQRLRNDVTVKRDGGSSATVTTDPAPAPEDRYDEEVTLSLDADLRLVDQAGWRLHIGAWEGMRYPSVSMEPSNAPHLVDAWLAADLGDRVTVDNLPPQHPVDAVDVLMEGYDETLSPTSWRVDTTCSPAGPWSVGIREDATEPARRDTAGTVLEDDMSTVDTVALLVFTDGIGWTEEASDYPFDLDIGGERVTATGIGEAGGIPYFDVIRSVNGVVKEHTAGEAVRLWQPAYRAL